MKRSDPGRILGLLWGTTHPAPNRGPRPKLTVEQIIQAGIHVADADGLENLSMRRVAEHLNVGTMSLYTYVPGRAELLHLMLDRAMGETPPLPEGTGWREALRTYTRMSRDLAIRHPWTVHASGPGLLLMGPNTTTRSEAVYAALAPLDLTAREKFAIASTLDGYVRGLSQSAADVEADTRTTGIDYEKWWADATPHLEHLVTRERFPHLNDMWETGVFDEPPEAAFDFGLERILDGIQHYLGTR